MKKRFIFDHEYNKRNAKKDLTKFLIIGAALLLAIVIVIVIILFTRSHKKPVNNEAVYELKEELVIKSGSYLPEVADYFKKLENIDVKDIKLEYPNEFEISYDTSLCSTDELEKLANKEVLESDLECAKQNLITPATYGIIITIDKNEYTVNLKVEDKEAPVLFVKPIEIFEKEGYKIEDFVSLCFDINGECKLSYEKEEFANIKEAGDYEIGIVAEDKYGNKSDVVLAHLKINKVETEIVTVTFNSDGGSSINPIRVDKGNEITEPDSPKKTGYKFLGWYQNNNLFDFSSKITDNITLIAKWEKEESGENIDPPAPPIPPQIITVSSVTLNYKKIYLTPGETKTVSATVRPTNAVDKTVVWKSSNESIATVQNGRITGIKSGTAIITATSGGKSASVEVVVREVTSTCKYGDVSYDHRYILSADLTQNKCAVDPNGTYNESVSANDYRKLTNTLDSLGYKIVDGSYHASHYKVRNNAGTGVVGYQITVSIEVLDKNNNKMSASYIIKADGGRQFLSNSIIGLK